MSSVVLLLGPALISQIHVAQIVLIQADSNCKDYA